MPTWPPIVTRSPTRVLPEIPVCATITEFFPIIDVVRDLHKIVDLHAPLNPRSAKPGTINGRVCADLDVIVDLRDPKLLNLLLPAIDHFKTKAVCTNDCAAVNNYSRTNPASLANSHERINQARGADCRFMSNVTSSANNCVIPDFGTVFDDGT